MIGDCASYKDVKNLACGGFLPLSCLPIFPARTSRWSDPIEQLLRSGASVRPVLWTCSRSESGIARSQPISEAVLRSLP